MCDANINAARRGSDWPLMMCPRTSLRALKVAATVLGFGSPLGVSSSFQDMVA